jgi:hypothetical protein
VDQQMAIDGMWNITRGSMPCATLTISSVG